MLGLSRGGGGGDSYSWVDGGGLGHRKRSSFDSFYEHRKTQTAAHAEDETFWESKAGARRKRTHTERHKIEPRSDGASRDSLRNIGPVVSAYHTTLRGQARDTALTREPVSQEYRTSSHNSRQANFPLRDR